MESCKYLIVGGGLAADAAVRGIRELDPSGSILVVSDEPDPPYDRPPLSKALWKGAPVELVWRYTETNGAKLRLGMSIVALDLSRKLATSENGHALSYEKLLLATGGSPYRLRDDRSSVIYFKRLSDFRRTRELASKGARFAVIGGGFVGPEIAAALAMNGLDVSLIFAGTCIGDRVYPRPLANFLNGYFRRHGVNVHLGERVESIEKRGVKRVVRTDAGSAILADAVVAGIGIEPNVDLARDVGLEVSDGIVVDETLRTRDPNVYAAGDVANFPCPALDRRMRFEHEDNAEAMGKAAGRNMAGGSEKYHHLPMFYSELFDISYEAVGEIDSSLDVVEDWASTFYRGVVYYLKHRRVRGLLLWNTRGLVEAARELIISKRAFDPTALIGRLPGGRLNESTHGRHHRGYAARTR